MGQAVDDNLDSLQILCDLIAELDNTGAMHVTRGFKLADVPPALIGNHLIEEACELQGAVLDGGDMDQIYEEAADTLLMLCHVLLDHGASCATLVERAKVKLAKTFTTDPSKVTAIGKGYTRATRGPKPLVGTIGGTVGAVNAHFRGE